MLCCRVQTYNVNRQDQIEYFNLGLEMSLNSDQSRRRLQFRVKHLINVWRGTQNSVQRFNVKHLISIWIVQTNQSTIPQC